MMPEMDGFAFIEELRKNDLWRQIPVVIVTAKEMTEDDYNRISGHVEYIVSKTGSSETDFLSRIRELVDQSTLRS
jgi:CheY-like chemotaxis protein